MAQARRMVDEGADLLDIGGESTPARPRAVDEAEELARVVPVVARLRRGAARPSRSRSTPPSPAWRRRPRRRRRPDQRRLGRRPATRRWPGWRRARRVPIVLMHNRASRVYRDLVAEVIADLQRALERALDAGCPRSGLIVDPGFGFGKTPATTSAAAGLAALRRARPADPARDLAQVDPGPVLDLPPDDALEATLPRRALGIAAGRRTSSGSTTCGRTSARRGWPTLSCAAGARRRGGSRR